MIKGSGFTTREIMATLVAKVEKEFAEQIQALTNTKANPVRHGFSKQVAESLKSGHSDGMRNMLHALIEMGIIVVHSEPKVEEEAKNA